MCSIILNPKYCSTVSCHGVCCGACMGCIRHIRQEDGGADKGWHDDTDLSGERTPVTLICSRQSFAGKYSSPLRQKPSQADITQYPPTFTIHTLAFYSSCNWVFPLCIVYTWIHCSDGCSVQSRFSTIIHIAQSKVVLILSRPIYCNFLAAGEGKCLANSCSTIWVFFQGARV